MENGQNRITEEVKFNVLTEVCSFINSEMPQEDQLHSIVEAANKVIGVRDSSLIMCDERTRQLQFYIVTGEKSQELKAMTLEPGEGIAGWVIEHGIPLVVPDVTADPRYSPRISRILDFETQSILCVPIRSRDKVIGSFEVVNRLDGRPFDVSDLPLLNAFAALIGIVLDNSKNRRAIEQSNLELENLVLTKTNQVEAANKNLLVKTQRLALTTKMISFINSNRNISDILSGVAKELQKLLPLDYVTVSLLRDLKDIVLLELLPTPQISLSEGLNLPLDEPVLKYVIQYKRPIFHNRPRWYRCFLDDGRFLEQRLNTMLCTPIMATENVLGTLNLGSIEKRQYPKETVDIVTFIGKQMGVALERDQLRSTLQEVNQELSEKTFELRKSIITMGDANLKLFDMQQQLREKDKRMKNLLTQVQKKNEELHDTLEELTQTQTQLVQSEKMASLGQLVAGIAHELNTPAGAIKAASEIIPDYIEKAFLAYEALLNAGLSIEYRNICQQLVQTMIESAKKRERKSTASIREQSKLLGQRLKDYDISNGRFISKDLARCYLEDHVDLVLQLFQHYDWQLVMDFLNNYSRVLISARDNQISIETISKIVRALKSYSYLDQAQERTVDLNEDLENTLTILHSQIPENVRIVQKFGELPKVTCLGSELNQVWTHIIQNALQALEETGGTITIETSADARTVSVKISDDGPGIPEDIRDKIFDPFFTTKRGKTSGLGLSIAQQVINKHHGTIALESTPGKTTFEILLPKEGTRLTVPQRKTSRIIEESDSASGESDHET